MQAQAGLFVRGGAVLSRTGPAQPAQPELHAVHGRPVASALGGDEAARAAGASRQQPPQPPGRAGASRFGSLLARGPSTWPAPGSPRKHAKHTIHPREIKASDDKKDSERTSTATHGG